MVARCSTDAATVFDDLRQAVRNIVFRSAGLLSTLPGRLRRRYPGITIHVKSGNPLSTSVGTCVPTIAIKNCGLRVVTLLLQL
jgi:hypothetical protein